MTKRVTEWTHVFVNFDVVMYQAVLLGKRLIRVSMWLIRVSMWLFQEHKGEVKDQVWFTYNSSS